MKLKMLEEFRNFKDMTITQSLKFTGMSKQANTDILVPSPLSKKIKSSKVAFIDDEEQALYNNAKTALGDDWRWTTEPVDYYINSHGYRMKEFRDIDWDNYMISLGCSLTFGVGLPEYETYSHRISRSESLDLINAGVMAGGNDLILTNLYTLLSAAPKPPKLVVISWSDITRKFYWDADGKPMPHYANINLDLNPKWKGAYSDFIRNDHAWAQEFREIQNQVSLLCRLSNAKCWQFTQFYGLEFDKNTDKLVFFKDFGSSLNTRELNMLFARDVDVSGIRLAHPGVEQQERIVQQFKRKFQTN